MNDIFKSIKEVAQIMTEITAATRERTTSLESINLVIAEMDNAIRMNAAGGAVVRRVDEHAGRGRPLERYGEYVPH